MSIRSELEALTRNDGMIYAEDVVRFAQANPNSEVGRHYDWHDRDKASWQHWLSQARRLIQVYIRTPNGERKTYSLVSDRQNGGGYRDIGQVLNTAQMRREACEQALIEIRRWRERNSGLSPELDALFEAIDQFQFPPRRPARRTRRTATGRQRGEEQRPGA